MEHFVMKIKKGKKKPTKPNELWRPGERHMPLGPLVTYLTHYHFSTLTFNILKLSCNCYIYIFHQTRTWWTWCSE